MASTYKIGATLAAAVDCATMNGRPMVQISYSNMAPDRATVTLSLNTDATLPSPLDVFGTSNYVGIWKDSTCIFRGVVQNPERIQRWDSERVTIELAGPWDLLERMPYAPTLTLYNTSGGTITTGFGANCAIEDQPNAQAIGTLCAYILNTWIGQTFYANGTFSLPNYSVAVPQSNCTIAQALRNVLKYVPDAIVSFDYSVNPPTINVFSTASASFAAFPWSSYTSTMPSFTAKDRYDLKVPEVYLQYVRRFTQTTISYVPSTTTGNISTNRSQFSGLAFVDVDTTNFQLGPQRIFQTIVLGGTLNPTVHSYTSPSFNTSGYYTLGYYLHRVGTGSPTFPNLIGLLPPGFVAQYPGVFGRPYNCNYTAQATPVSPTTGQNPLAGTGSNGSGEPTTGYAFYVIPETLTPPTEVQRASDLTSGIELWDIKLVLNFYTTDGTNLWVSATVTVRVQYWTGVTTVQRAVAGSDATLEAAPNGIAASVKSAASALRCQGSVEIEMEEPVLPTKFQRKIVAPNGSTGVIQSVACDIEAGRTSVSFGPPDHLKPDDWRNLFQAMAAQSTRS